MAVSKGGIHYCPDCLPQMGPPDASSFEAAALMRLRRAGHWDTMLGGWLILVACTYSVMSLGGLFCLIIPVTPCVFGGVAILRANSNGARSAAWGMVFFAFLHLLAVGPLGLNFRFEEQWWMAVALWGPIMLIFGTLYVLRVYHQHPFNKFRRNEINAERLCDLMGEHRFNALIHKLTLEGQDVADEPDL